MKKAVILNGIHTSGKTLVGNYLSKNGMQFYPELAMDIYSNGESIGKDARSLQIQLMVLENERDREIYQSLDRAVIESWHTAELAHAMLNEPENAVTVRKNLETCLGVFDPLVIYMDLNPESIRSRGSGIYPVVNDQVIGFYHRLDRCYQQVFADLGLSVVRIDAEQAPGKVCQKALEASLVHLG